MLLFLVGNSVSVVRGGVGECVIDIDDFVFWEIGYCDEYGLIW